MTSEKVRSLKRMCLVVPVIALAAAHWFPWKQVLGHDLHRLEAYAIGTAAIVGTSAVAISRSEDDGDEHLSMLLIAAISAGVTTLLAWALDALVVGRPTKSDMQSNQP